MIELPVFGDRYSEIAFDLETKDDTIKTKGPGWCFPDAGFVAGVAVAYGNKQEYYGKNHEGGGNCDPDQFDRWLRDEILLNDRVTRVCHNGVYDVGWSETEVDTDIRGTVTDNVHDSPAG